MAFKGKVSSAENLSNRERKHNFYLKFTLWYSCYYWGKRGMLLMTSQLPDTLRKCLSNPPTCKIFSISNVLSMHFLQTLIHTLPLITRAFCPHLMYRGENGLIWESLNDTGVQHRAQVWALKHPSPFREPVVNEWWHLTVSMSVMLHHTKVSCFKV